MKESVPATRTQWSSYAPRGVIYRTGFAIVLGVLATTPSGRAGSIEFDREIAPILVKRCSECHGPDKQKAKLRLDSRAAALQGGESGHPAVSPGHPDESCLLYT